MTSPKKNPLFIYSYDPPSPQRLSEYDPPYPEEVLSPYNERNFLKFEFNQYNNLSEKEHRKESIDEESVAEPISDIQVNQFFEKKFPDEIGYIAGESYIKYTPVEKCVFQSSNDNIDTISLKETQSTTLATESSSYSYLEKFYFSSSENCEVFKTVNDSSEVKMTTSSKSNQKISHDYIMKDSIAPSNKKNEKSDTSSEVCNEENSNSNVAIESKLTTSREDNSAPLTSENAKNISNAFIENSHSILEGGEQFVSTQDTTTSDYARCSSPQSTTQSISSLPSDTFTINVPCDWSTSDSEIPTLDCDSDIPKASADASKISSFHSEVSTRDGSYSSFNAAIDVSTDSALTSSPPFSPVLTESCTITPLPTDYATPDSTNPTSTPLPSPIPFDLLFASPSESSPSTPSTVTTSDMYCVSRKLEHLTGNVVKGDSGTNNNNIKCNIITEFVPHVNREADTSAITTKNSTVAQLSAIFESRCTNQIETNVDNFSQRIICSEFDTNTYESVVSEMGPGKSIDHKPEQTKHTENYNKLDKATKNLNETLPLNISASDTKQNINKDKFSDSTNEVNNKNIHNTAVNHTILNDKTEMIERENSQLRSPVSGSKWPPPPPPPRLISSYAVPPPLPPPPAEYNDENAPAVPELPLNFNFTCSVSRNQSPPQPPLRQYLLIPLTPGRKTPILFSPPYIPPRSVSFSRTPTSPLSSKSHTPSFDKNGQGNHLPFINENVYLQSMDENGYYFDEFSPCPKKENGFVQILTPVPEERISPRAYSPSSPLKFSDIETASVVATPASINKEGQISSEMNVLETDIKTHEKDTVIKTDQKCTSENPPEIPPPPEDQTSGDPPPLPPKPSLLKLSAVSSPTPSTPPPPPPKRSNSLSCTPVPKIIFSTPEPFSDKPAIDMATATSDPIKSSTPNLQEKYSPPLTLSALAPAKASTPLETTPPSESSAPPFVTIRSSVNSAEVKPPLMSVSPYGKLVINRSDLPLLLPVEEVRKAFTNAKSYGWIKPEVDTLALYTQVRPIIQQGPQCGLVALSMASQLCSSTVSVEELLEKAREKGFSSHGEMFSAESMTSLANECVSDVQASVRTDIFSSAASLVKTLMEGDLILVPYDADHNHQPGFHQGRKAHWGLICGCLLQSSSMILKPEFTSAKLDVQMDNLWHFRPIRAANATSNDRPSSVPPKYPHGLLDVNMRNARSVSPNAFASDISLKSPLTGDGWCSGIMNLILLWRQGKSRNLIISPFEDLRRSNEQLLEYTDIKDYVIGNVGKGLSCQVVVLHKVKHGLSDLLGALQQDLKL